MGRKPTGSRAMTAAERMQAYRRRRKFTPCVNELGAPTFRPSDDELHRLANKYLWEAEHLLFSALPSILDQIIEHRAWESLSGSQTFADYALAQTSAGLCINNDHRVLLLKCALAVDDGKHADEWQEVQAGLERLQQWKVGQRTLDRRAVMPRTRRRTQ